jgi:hypothetical protein
MRGLQHRRTAFHPDLRLAALEERLVLSAVGTSTAELARQVVSSPALHHRTNPADAGQTDDMHQRTRIDLKRLVSDPTTHHAHRSVTSVVRARQASVFVKGATNQPGDPASVTKPSASQGLPFSIARLASPGLTAYSISIVSTSASRVAALGSVVSITTTSSGTAASTGGVSVTGTNPPFTGVTNPPFNGTTNPPFTGVTNPPFNGTTNPPFTGVTNPPFNGTTNPPFTGN